MYRQLIQKASPLVQRSVLLNRTAPVTVAQTVRYFAQPALFKPSVIATLNKVNRLANYTSIRSISKLSESKEATPYDYAKVKAIVSNPEKHPDSILVDVREPVEFQEGHIPGAINLPFKSSPGALSLNQEEFQDTFGFDKPDKEKELVFYCLGGVRSTAAEELANTFGYEKRGNYKGSYEDWVSNENQAKK